MEKTIDFAVDRLTEKRNISVEVITPVHVGASNDKLLHKSLDFLIEDDDVFVLNKNKLFRLLWEHDLLDIYEEKLLAMEKMIVWDLLDEIGADPTQVSDRTYDCSRADPAGEIRPLIRNGMGEAYLPGSSIKGAIRSVLFNFFAEKNNGKSFLADLQKNRMQARDIGKEITKKEKEWLGHFTTSIFRFVRPADVLMDKTDLANIELFNLNRGGGSWYSKFKERFLITAEVFPKGAKGNLKLGISDGIIKGLKTVYKNERGAKTPANWSQVFDGQDNFLSLFAIINNYTKKHLQREIEFFEKYDDAEDTDLIIDSLTDLLEKTDAPNACLLRMSYGAGFHGITGDWRYGDHTYSILRPDELNRVYSRSAKGRVPARYKSRRISGTDEDTALMGFLQLKL